MELVKGKGNFVPISTQVSSQISAQQTRYFLHHCDLNLYKKNNSFSNFYIFGKNNISISCVHNFSGQIRIDSAVQDSVI